MLFQPPSTRYDLNFSIFDIPVRVHPLFWLLGLLIGASSRSLTFMLVWVGALFVSILIHELGHSLMMRRFGIDSYIILHMMGGLAVPRGGRGGYNANEQILISLAGPVAGFILAGLTIVVGVMMGGTFVIGSILFLPIPAVAFSGGGLVPTIVGAMLWINIFWGLVNLLPVYPLDGGQVARAWFIKTDPWEGARKSLMLSTAVGAIAAVGGLLLFSSPFMLLLFGSLAAQSYQMMQGGGGPMY
ncbi:MAG TPA: site-2 protease family protein [Anaerolineae bacterium]|nr:site-2 protease family protein [Anaerolineae bacterium]